MQAVPKSKKKKTRSAKSRSAVDALDQLRPGMPAKDNIIKVVDFVPRKDSEKVHYKILKTTEMDAYDAVPRPRKSEVKP
jgi:hypothetical protein